MHWMAITGEKLNWSSVCIYHVQELLEVCEVHGTAEQPNLPRGRLAAHLTARIAPLTTLNCSHPYASSEQQNPLITSALIRPKVTILQDNAKS